MQQNAPLQKKESEGPESSEWNAADYKDGYNARFAGSLESDSAAREWQTGWRDANIEILESSRQQRLIEEGVEVSFQETGLDLYHAGGMARIHGFPFDEDRTRPWKQGWIADDLSL